MTTTKTLLALAATGSFANAATLLQTSDPTAYTDAAYGEGNWHYQSLTLNDAGFVASGDALAASATLDSVTFVHDASSSNAGLYLVVLTDATDSGTVVAQSSNTIDMGPLNGGDLFTFNFGGDTLSTSTEYFFAFYVDTTGEGSIGAGDTASTARFAFQGDQLAGGLRSAPSGGISSGSDASMNIVLNTAAVPEPSSSALLGLGGLALILRRRK